jgi:hypothetical protein
MEEDDDDDEEEEEEEDDERQKHRKVQTDTCDVMRNKIMQEMLLK